MMHNNFESCGICGHDDWQIAYRGVVRDGAFRNFSKDDCIVAKCLICGVERLNETACKDDVFYETEEYRRLLKQPEDAAGFMEEHDLQLYFRRTKAAGVYFGDADFHREALAGVMEL